MKFTVLALSLSALFAQSAWAAPTENISASASLSVKHAASTPGTYSLSLEKQVQNTPMEVNDISSEPEDDTWVDDMMKEGWPEDQAEMVMSLLDAVDKLINFPLLNDDTNSTLEYDQATFMHFNGLRADMNQLLAEAGYRYKSIGSQRRVLTRLDVPNIESEQATFIPPSLTSIVHGIVSLIRSAHKFSELLNSQKLEDYTEALLEAAQTIEKVLSFPSGGIFTDKHP